MPYEAFSTADYTPSTTPPVLFGTDLVVLDNLAALKAVATVNLPLGTVRNVASVAEGEVRQAWQLVEGEGADVEDLEADPPITVGTDYDDPDNLKIWQRTL